MDVRRRNRHGLEYGGEINIDDLQPRAVAPPPKWRRVVENSLWLSAASYILYYGDSHSNFFTVLTSNPRIVRLVFQAALSMIVHLTLFLLSANNFRLIDGESKWKGAFFRLELRIGGSCV